MKIIGIKMKTGCYTSNALTEIDELLIKDNNSSSSFYKKEDVHNYLLSHPHSIYVDVSPYPYAIPATSKYGEKYVKSLSNDSTQDNILELPRY